MAALSMETHIMLCQHGFPKRRICFRNILWFSDEVTRKFGQGNPEEMRHLDFSKAFGLANNRPLLLKLGAFGMLGGPVK